MLFIFDDKKLIKIYKETWGNETGDEDETRKPQNEDPDFFINYHSKEIYNRAAGQERGE